MPVKVLDNGLALKAGHHYSFNKTLVGHDPEIKVYSFNNVSLDILNEGWVTPAFSHWLYISTSTDQITSSLDNFIGLGEAFEQDLFKNVPIDDSDTILLHTANPPVIYGLSRHLRKTNKRPKVKFLHALPGMKNFSGKFTENFVYYKKAFTEMTMWGGNFDVGVLTEWLLPEIGAIGAAGKVVPPIVMNKASIKEATDTPIFGFLGHATGVKGLDLLLEAIRVDKNPSYLLQVNPIKEVNLEGVQVLEGELSSEGYVAALGGMDALVLPYNGDYYREYTSGVFLEAICSGRPVIIPRDTWMEFEAKRKNIGYTTFKNGSVVELLAAINEMRENWPENYNKSIAAAPELAKKYSVEEFLNWVKA
jgi:glycosyltransferase involved in cell wall biosynthesis